MSAQSVSRQTVLKGALTASSYAFAISSCGWAQGLGRERTEWYRQAKFGMFVHWGPYSQASIEASWPIMVPKPGGISESEYRALAATFNATRFDPHAWVDLAREAGQKYIVFTTKHHDGFCMFDSVYTDYKVTRTPYGKDIASQLVQACDEDEMPLRFYYSPPDLHHPRISRYQ
jgi:alpha-L-fucosidase